VIDTMLGATAIEHNLYLVTRKVKDTKPSGAMVFDPWNDNATRGRRQCPTKRGRAAAAPDAAKRRHLEFGRPAVEHLPGVLDPALAGFQLLKAYPELMSIWMIFGFEGFESGSYYFSRWQLSGRSTGPPDAGGLLLGLSGVTTAGRPPWSTTD
jgi:hypothetical protein